jgi:hypothetical protein
MEPISPNSAKKTTRLRKYVRDPRVPRLELTLRDLEVLRTIGEFGLATRQQLQILFFPSLQTASTRLKLLYHHGYLERWVYPRLFFDLRAAASATSQTFGSPPLVYSLTRDGSQMVAAFLGQETGPPVLDRSSEIRNPLFLAHRLGLLDLRVALLGAAHRVPGEALLSWDEEALQEGTAGSDETPSAGWLRPDALFFYGIGEKKLIAFVELDRGTERGPKLLEKLTRYVAYGRTDRFFQRYGRRRYRVLFLVPTAERRAVWQDHLASVTGDPEEQQQFWVGLPEAVSPEGLRQPVWQRGDDPTFRPFLPSLEEDPSAGKE